MLSVMWCDTVNSRVRYKYAARYHLGSVAFGSLLIAICQLIRIFLEFLDRRLKGAENRVAKFIVK